MELEIGGSLNEVEEEEMGQLVYSAMFDGWSGDGVRNWWKFE